MQYFAPLCSAIFDDTVHSIHSIRVGLVTLIQETNKMLWFQDLASYYNCGADCHINKTIDV